MDIQLCELCGEHLPLHARNLETLRVLYGTYCDLERLRFNFRDAC